jgi:O-antigen ligase/tetratricopeptide (TPR) repeat protein
MDIKAVARWAVYIPLFIIPFLPLYVANDLFFPFITGKAFAFRILVEIAACGYVVLALAEPKYRPRFSWTFVLYSAFVAWMFIADAFAVNPHKAFWSNFERSEGWVTLIHVFLFFVVTSAVLSVDKLWRSWWLTFISASALLSAYCLLQLSGAIVIHQGGVRVDGTFGNAAYLAAYLLFALAVTLWQGIASRGWLRYLLYALGAIQVILIFFTATRGAILGLVGAAAVGTLLWAFEAGGRTRKTAIGVFIAIVVLAGGFYMLRGTAFVKSDPTLDRISSIGPADLSVRTTLWKMALEGVATRPITGWGQEGYNYIFNTYYEPSLYAQEPWFDRAHNVFIDWLVAGGIPALLLFLAVLASALIALYRGGATREERILLVAALVAYGIQGIVVFDNLFTYVPLAAILATAHAISSRPYKKIEALPAISEASAQMALPIAVVVAIAIIWVVNVPNIAAASELVRAISLTSNDISPNITYFQKALGEHTYADQEIREQLMMFASNVASQQQGASPALSQLLSFSISEMGKEVALQPKDARLRLEYALGYRVAGDYQDALAQIETAHELSPKKQTILLEQGFDYWQTNQFDKARDSFNAAYQLDTSFPALAAYAAAGDIAAGDATAGKQLLLEKVGTTTVDNEALILAYYNAKDYSDLILTLELQVRDQSGSAQSHFRLAAAYVAAGRIADAHAEIQKAVAEHPETAAQAAAFLKQLGQ